MGLKPGLGGVRHRFGIMLTPDGGGALTRSAQYIKQALSEVGLEVNLEATDWPTQLRRSGNWEFDCDTNSYGEYGDPAIGTSRFYLSSNIRKGVPLTNLQGYINPEVDRLFAQAAVAVSHQEAQACYSRLQQILTHDVAMVWLYERKPVFFYNKRLKNRDHGPQRPQRRLWRARLADAGMKPRYIAMRLVKTVLVAIAVVVLSFFLIRLAPGDAATVMAGQSGYADEAFMKNLRAEYGLDQPLPVQFWKYVGAVAHGDLGTLLCAAPAGSGRDPGAAAQYPAAGCLCAAGGGRRAGCGWAALAARRPGSAGDNAVTVLSMLFYAVPQFWLGMMMVLVFAVWLAVLPPFGIETMGADYTGLARLGDVAEHMILPGVTLALYYMASYARLTRAAMIEVSDQDFVKTARAKGISERQVARRHILRNALIPLVTYAGLQASLLVGGSVLIENVFSWPGVGTLAYEAVQARDNPLLLGIFIVTAILVCLFNLLTDIAYSIVDPRVELG